MEHYDVVIVGAGMAGALLADALLTQKPGLKLAILESGPRAKDRSEMMKKYFASALKLPDTPYDDYPQAPKAQIINPSAYYDQQKESGFQSTYERLVGGTSWHWLGTCLRFLPQDFKMQSTYQRGADWPISYQDLEPWYQRAEEELGVAGDSQFDLGSPRKKAYPKRAIPLSYLDKKLSASLKGLQLENQTLVVNATPQARDPDRCVGSRSCIPLCPTSAKYEAETHVQRAIQKGAHLFTQAVAHRLDVDEKHQITKIHFLSWQNQETRPQGISARYFVLAANAIETPKLLLMSTSERTPHGVANHSQQVGRYLMDHPSQVSWALSHDPIYPYRGPISTAGIDNLRDGAFRRQRAAFRIEFHNDGWNWPTGAPNSSAEALIDQGLTGSALREALKAQLSRELCFSSLVEQLPDANNRVSLSDKKDALGLPRPKIYYRLGEYEKNGLAAARKAHEHIFSQVGVSQFDHVKHFYGAGHIMGTLRMGEDPKSSVVNSKLQTHEHNNLFLLGSGVFPTGAAANPSLTIAALALRLAKALLGTLA